MSEKPKKQIKTRKIYRRKIKVKETANRLTNDSTNTTSTTITNTITDTYSKIKKKQT